MSEKQTTSFKQKWESSDLLKRVVSSVFLLLLLGIYVGLAIIYTEGSRSELKNANIAAYFNWAITLLLVGASAYELLKVLGVPNKDKWLYYLVGISLAIILFIFPMENDSNRNWTWDLIEQMNVVSWYQWYIVFLIVLLGVVVFFGIPCLARGSFKQGWKPGLLLVIYMFVMILGYKGFSNIALGMALDGKHPYFGFNTILWIWMTIILTDTFAYFGGRRFGKTKMAPVISPKKTWEGSGIGTAVALLIGTLYSVLFFYFLEDYAPFVEPLRGVYRDNRALPGVILGLMTLMITFASQIGDLFFSWYKRVFEVKDYSNLIPGHGGILDRLDSFLFVFFIMYFLTLAA